ncbi:MAG: tetratricopeptide repeat protein [Isosphaerales bacterium]
MTAESPPEAARKPRETPVRPAARSEPSGRTSWVTRAADGCLIVLFLMLTFLLGAFPLKDTDIYWHLRTGDLIRQTGHVPRADIFTFSNAGRPWIDLHWLFQIAVSWVHERGGVVALSLAKCAVTCVAMLFLLTARRREWPLWVMVLAWLPALLVLGGRMYVRPETLTLLYLSIFLAVISRWERFPKLALLLPLVQVAWVNSQGLFVLGPIVLSFGLIDAALRGGLLAPERRKWWRTILVASVLTGAACLVNPYGIRGALYPLELAGTMSNPIFSQYIAELMPIPAFIRSAGLWNLPLQLHFATMLMGALSFLVPLFWLIGVRLAGPGPGARVTAVAEESAAADPGTAGRGNKRSRSRTERRKRTNPDLVPATAVDPNASWRVSPFRLLLYAAFCVLSFQATRNSHQFAAMVGTVTAWNFGEWAAALERRRKVREGTGPASSGAAPRLVALGAVGLLLLWVGSGRFYKMTGEGRTIGLGEEPLWYPHQAVLFAGEPGMPARFLSFHNGHASLFEYEYGPQRQVYTDPRLEVAGADLFKRYIELDRRITKDEPGWEAELDEMRRPVILVDHEHNWQIGATLLRSTHWRCVWFDAIAAVFVHDSFTEVVRAHAVDFAARHFRPDRSKQSPGIAELALSSKAFRKYVTALAGSGGDQPRPLVWLGSDDARRVLQKAPDSIEAWKDLGQLELFREPPPQLVPRFRAPFDPVFDLSIVRATYALRHAMELAPHDSLTLMTLKMAYDSRLMHEAALPLLDRMEGGRAIERLESLEQTDFRSMRAEYQRKLGSPPSIDWRNLSDLDRIVTAQLGTGRAESAARLLEQAHPAERAPWEVVDRIATLRLHLGEPARARDLWRKAVTAPQPDIRDARIGTTYLVEGDFEAARRHLRQALEARPDSFEANYCLAVLEQDAGDAQSAYELARKAAGAAPDEAARSAARAIAFGAARFARRTGTPTTADPRALPASHSPARSP